VTDRPRVVVVGLGPGGPDLLTAGTLDAIASVPARHLRTRRHPAATAVPDAASFDAVYDAAATVSEVYPAIVEALVEAAVEHGDVLYAVPGSPLVAEHTVELLLDDDRVQVEVLPALSFLDLAWVRLGIDPVSEGVRVVDGHRFAVEAAGERGPLLVAQCDSAHVLSDVKLALDAGLDPALADDATVVVLQRLGLPDERVESIPWTDLDRVEADHLTSVYLPELAAPVARELTRFVDLVAVLRAECPWDREQTHDSLRRHLLEESYEVLEAIDHLDVGSGEGYDHLEEELGDLLFQVLFHSQLATEAGRFTVADVAATVHDKLVSRHPHVFGDVDAHDADAVVANWEQIKKAEKGRESVFDGVPDAIPALLYALKVQKKAATLADGGLDVAAAARVALPDEALAEAHRRTDDGTVGALLFAVVDQARLAGVDPETALRAAAVRYRDAVRAAELAGAPPSATGTAPPP
jgi:tetrapyrrole methylase family protein/MazG family protein